MRDAGPSRTAIGVAIHRAVHQTIDAPPIFHDPLAVRIIGAKARAAIAEGRAGRGALASVLRTVLAVRARVAEDTLADAVSAGVRQYVVLGAGLDTFGLRNQDPSLTVFEVDHPNTQAWKRRRIAEEGLIIPPTLRFAAVDFTKDDLAAALHQAGLRRDLPTFFSWLGVVPYLEPQAIRATLETVAAAAGTTGGVVFDFIAPPRRSQLLLRLILWLRGRRVARLGEPFRAPLAPADAERWLRNAGFAEVTTLSSHQLSDRYLRGRQRRLSPLTYVAVARGSTGTLVAKANVLERSEYAHEPSRTSTKGSVVIVVAAAVIEHDGAFLVTRRLEGTHLAGLWEFPGGKIASGESHADGLRREIREELDADVDVGALVYETTHDYAERSMSLHFYRCTLRGSPRPLLGQDMQWVPRSQLRALDFPPADEELIRRLAEPEPR